MGLLSLLFGRSGPKAKLQPDRSPNLKPAPAPSPASQAQSGPFIRWREGSFPMQVVGESNYQGALIAICGRHTRHGYEGEHVALIEREPSNSYDPNAIRVMIEGRKVGYLSREQAVRVGEQMIVAGLTRSACAARVRGGWRTNQHDEGHYGVSLSIPNQGWIDFGIGAEPPAREPVPRTKKDTPQPSPHGPLVGHQIAIMGGGGRSGKLAAELAAAGARIMAGVGKSTTLLVVTAERPFDFGIRRSANYCKALEVIEAGSTLQIMSESEVKTLMGRDGVGV